MIIDYLIYVVMSSKLSILNAKKYPHTRGAKPLIAQNPRESLKKRGQNKTTMNYSKESSDIKSVSKPGKFSSLTDSQFCDFLLSVFLSLCGLILIVE